MNIKLWLISNGAVAEQLKLAAETILAEETSIQTFCYKREELTDFEKTLEKEVEKLSAKQQVIALVDLFGSTPANVLCRLAHDKKLVLISGLNLALTVKAWQWCAKQEEIALELLAEKLVRYGQNKIFLCPPKQG